MKRIVREHYPVSKLPEDLREGLDRQADVRVTIDAPASTESNGPLEMKRPMSLDALFALGRPTSDSLDAVDDHVRSLRGEWD